MRDSICASFQVLTASSILVATTVFAGIEVSSGDRSIAGTSRETGRSDYVHFAQLTSEGAKQATVPPLRVQVQVGTQQRRIGGYRKQMEINPRIVLEGVTKGVPIPELEATMIIITMDTRAKYVQRREAYRVENAQTIQIPTAGNGARREIPFEQSLVSFDAWRDHTNLGGATYKYYVFGLRDPQTKAIIDFQTNNPQLASFCKSNPDRREEFLDLKKGAEFPHTIK